MMARALIVAGLGLVGMLAVALVGGVTVLMLGYLAALVAIQGVALGCLVLLLVDHLLPDSWSFRRIPALEAAALTLPLVGLAILPILDGLGRIYPWASMAAFPPDWPQPVWLAPALFRLRTLIYAVVWSLAAGLGASRSRGVRRPAAAGLALLAVTLTSSFASFDWLMSLEPPFHSTIFGLMVLVGQILTGLAFLGLLPQGTPIKGLGGTVLAVLLLWGYLDFMQYLVIWSTNLPPEIAWLQRRATPWWWAIGLPAGAAFALLIQRPVRRSLGGLRVACGLIVVLRAVETAWWVLPAGSGPAVARGLAFAAALMTLGGLWLAVFLLLLARRHRVVMEGADG